MTDREVICTFMEPKPTLSPGKLRRSRGAIPNWWTPHCHISGEWSAIILTLNECREVQERLTDEQCRLYNKALRKGMKDGDWFWHVTAEQKIIALAAVLRPIVEAT